MKASALLRLAAAGLLGVVGVAVSGAPAGAIDAAKPVPCNGVHITDSAGDGEYDPSGTFPAAVGGGVGPAPDNLELLRVFMNYKPGTDGKKELTANLVLKNMSGTVPEGAGASGGIWYYAHFGYGDKAQFVRAMTKGDDVWEYAYGSVSEQGVYTTEGDTTGVVFNGPEGIVQIVVPEAVGGKPGETLVGLLGAADTIEGEDDFFGFNHHADLAPDETDVTAPNGKDYKVIECPAEAGGGTTTSPTPTTTTPGGTTTTPAQPSGPTTLPFKASSTLGKARSARKGKKLAIKVTAGKPISNLRVALKKRGGKSPAYAKATIASLKQGTSKIKIKFVKTLKKGKYTLQATGVVDGQASSTSQTVRLK